MVDGHSSAGVEDLGRSSEAVDRYEEGRIRIAPVEAVSVDSRYTVVVEVGRMRCMEVGERVFLRMDWEMLVLSKLTSVREKLTVAEVDIVAVVGIRRIEVLEEGNLVVGYGSLVLDSRTSPRRSDLIQGWC